jgi:hypothetical protein
VHDVAVLLLGLLPNLVFELLGPVFTLLSTTELATVCSLERGGMKGQCVLGRIEHVV